MCIRDRCSWYSVRLPQKAISYRPTLYHVEEHVTMGSTRTCVDRFTSIQNDHNTLYGDKVHIFLMRVQRTLNFFEMLVCVSVCCLTADNYATAAATILEIIILLYYRSTFSSKKTAHHISCHMCSTAWLDTYLTKIMNHSPCGCALVGTVISFSQSYILTYTDCPLCHYTDNHCSMRLPGISDLYDRLLRSLAKVLYFSNTNTLSRNRAFALFQ